MYQLLPLVTSYQLVGAAHVMGEELVLCANMQLWMAKDWYYRYCALPASWPVLKVAGLGCTISVGMHIKKASGDDFNGGA